MAEAPKRKRLEKAPDPSSTAVPPARYYCCRCGTAYSRRKGYFPVSHSPMYRGSGFLPLCGDCVEDMYEGYRDTLHDDRAAMKRMCMKLDLYWNEDIYTMVERTAGVHSRVKNYIGKTNLFRYIDKTFDDTLREEEEKCAVDSQNSSPEYFDSGTDDPESQEPVSQELVDFWGSGYKADFYEELERRYQDWTGGTPVADPSERSLYRQICLLEAIIARDGAAGKPIDKNVNALNSLLGSMNLKPAQKKNDAADAELEKMPLGVGIQKWEYSRPLPETPKENRDVRGTIKNITTWYLGHACKMVGLRNSYCKMYEDAMEELRVKRPEYDEEDDDSVLSDIFGGQCSQKDDDV